MLWLVQGEGLWAGLVHSATCMVHLDEGIQPSCPPNPVATGHGRWHCNVDEHSRLERVSSVANSSKRFAWLSFGSTVGELTEQPKEPSEQSKAP